jgi:DNA-binding beta-propeller fold protein YncE
MNKVEMGNQWRWLVALAAMVLAACAPLPEKTPVATDDDAFEIKFPPAPDEPRFVYERMIMGSADVATPDEKSRLRALLTGESASSVGLGKPYAVAVHQGRIFVSDTVNRAIMTFDVPSGKFMKIGETDAGTLAKPLGLDVDAAGNLYVADGTLKIIVVFDRDGKRLRTIGEKGSFDRLSSVTVNPEGTRVYAVDIGGVQSENHRVRVFDALTGEHVADIGKRGSAPGEFNLPRDLAIGRDGRLYVVDSGNFRVQIFDRDGKYLSSFGKVGKQLGDFARPKEIATDPEGNVYVADAAFGNFQVFTPDGDLLMFVGQRAETNGPARYMLPSGIFVDEDGRVYMVDQWFRKVDVFRPFAIKRTQGYLVKRPDSEVTGSASTASTAGKAQPATVAGK